MDRRLAKCDAGPPFEGGFVPLRRGFSALGWNIVPAFFGVARTSAQRGLLLHHKQDRDLPPVCKLLQNPDVMIVICEQIAVAASASHALQGINHNEFRCRMLH